MILSYAVMLANIILAPIFAWLAYRYRGGVKGRADKIRFGGYDTNLLAHTSMAILFCGWALWVRESMQMEIVLCVLLSVHTALTLRRVMSRVEPKST